MILSYEDQTVEASIHTGASLAFRFQLLILNFRLCS
jgi:hypothetical protein